MERRVYTPAEHQVWRTLYTRMLPRWEQFATDAFLSGVEKLNLHPGHVPQLAEINARLRPLTGFQAVEVPGYVPAVEFFGHLRRRQFPTVTTLRRADQLDYLPEPDIFHDVAGHVPMHTNAVFADTLARFGALAENLHDDDAVSQPLARFFWFTIEFGLMDCGGQLKAYGSGLLSSYGELEFALTSRAVERRPFQLAEVLATPFAIDHFQNRLYVLESFEQLYAAVEELESSLPLVSGSRYTSTAPSKK
jgi:phenylalanine-4-hydroxylase